MRNIIALAAGYIANRVQTARLSKVKVSEWGLNDEERAPRLVVSLTTYPERIDAASKTIKTLLTQSCKPDDVILWLAEDQFPKRLIPDSITCLERFGLHIEWCEDLKSYKKLIPALKKYPEDVIVTADDDNYYSKDWLGALWDSYKKNPQCIHCHRATKFSYKNGWNRIAGGRDYYATPSFRNMQTGVGGVLYPPNSLHPDVLDEDVFASIAPTNDDLWFWFMAVRSNTRVCVVDNPIYRSKPVEGTYDSGLYYVNTLGEGLFEKALKSLMTKYPEVENALFNEERGE